MEANKRRNIGAEEGGEVDARRSQVESHRLHHVSYYLLHTCGKKLWTVCGFCTLRGTPRERTTRTGRSSTGPKGRRVIGCRRAHMVPTATAFDCQDETTRLEDTGQTTRKAKVSETKQKKTCVYLTLVLQQLVVLNRGIVTAQFVVLLSIV